MREMEERKGGRNARCRRKETRTKEGRAKRKRWKERKEGWHLFHMYVHINILEEKKGRKGGRGRKYVCGRKEGRKDGRREGRMEVRIHGRAKETEGQKRRKEEDKCSGENT
jgi:hypothetical protein